MKPDGVDGEPGLTREIGNTGWFRTEQREHHAPCLLIFLSPGNFRNNISNLP
jgi:hypothetical protein